MAEGPYVGRGGLKLEHALREFQVDCTGIIAADFGCNIGGFTDCLLRHGATRVYAVDTGYGMLDYNLRRDDRVVVMERTNALHAPAPQEPVDLVVIDAGWTPQRLIVPAALRWLGGREGGRIITLVKPHYERSSVTEHRTRRSGARLQRGVLEDDQAELIARRVVADLAGSVASVLGLTRSPIRGGASKGRKGNLEFLAVLGAPKSSGEPE